MLNASLNKADNVNAACRAILLTFPASTSCSLVTGLDTGTDVDPGGRLKSESFALTPNSMGGTGMTLSTWISTPLTGVMGPSRRSMPSEPLRFFSERSLPIGPGLCSLLCSGPASESWRTGQLNVSLRLSSLTEAHKNAWLEKNKLYLWIGFASRVGNLLGPRIATWRLDSQSFRRKTK